MYRSYHLPECLQPAPELKFPESDETLQSGSCRINTVDGVEIWLSPINRVFVKSGRVVSFPSLGGNVLRWDNRDFIPSQPVAEAVTKLLRKQSQLRMAHWPEHNELEAAAEQYN